MSDIEALSALISQSVQVIAKACSSRGISLPDLNSPFDKDADIAFRDIPDVTDAVNIITAAAAQLTAALLPPAQQLQNIGGGVRQQNILLSVLMCSYILESYSTQRPLLSVLLTKRRSVRSCATRGRRYGHSIKVQWVIHLYPPLWSRAFMSTTLPKSTVWTRTNSVSAPRYCTSLGLTGFPPAHYLRLLAFHHVFREIRPDVFANNRLSSLLDTGFPVKDLIAEYVYAPRYTSCL